MNRDFHASLAASGLSSIAGRRPYLSDKRLCSRVLRVIVALALFVGTILSNSVTHAQTFYGSISGVVKDPSGAVMPGVAVTVSENNTTTEYKTVTNKAGSYRVSFLKPATYTVHFKKDGFAEFATGQVNIVLNQTCSSTEHCNSEPPPRSSPSPEPQPS